VKKQGPNTLPKPFGTYYYKISGSDLQIIIRNEAKGWASIIRTYTGDSVRVCEYYPTKMDAMNIAIRELKSLDFKKKQIDTMVNYDSIYEYHTFPAIKIFSKGSKWGWVCGDKRKKQAIEKACKHRKDI
jgi:hypothetical protein